MDNKLENLPVALQVHLHEQGLLSNPDFTRDHTGMIVRDIRKIKAHIKEHGEPPH